MHEHIKAQLEDLSANIEEVLESAASVRGEAFALGVSAHFEAAQLIELMARLASLTEDEHKEYAEALCDASMNVLGSLVQKGCQGMDSDTFKEAMDLGCSLFSRRNRTVEQIKKRMEDEGDD